MLSRIENYIESIQKSDAGWTLVTVLMNAVPFYFENTSYRIAAHIICGVLSIVVYSTGTRMHREELLDQMNEELDKEAYDLYQVLTKMGDFDVDRSIEILTAIKVAKEKHFDFSACDNSSDKK